MEITGSQLIPASQADTWNALNDPETLKACIPGCETIEKGSDSEYHVTMTARIGPVAAKFRGKLVIADADPPHAYSLSFEGKGGAAGFAKGVAKVKLVANGDATVLGYTASAQVGGKLAQIGSRLVDGAAKKVADDFFAAFKARLAAPAGPAAAATVETASTARRWLGVAAVIGAALAVLVMLLLFGR